MTTPEITVYGIRNCDSVKKTRVWLDNQNLKYRFHDFRVDGLPPSLLDSFIDAVGYETLINQRSTSWRQLTDDQKIGLNAAKAANLLLATPTLIKRPIICYQGQISVGRQAQDIIRIHD